MKKWMWVTLGILSGGLVIAAAVITWRKQSNYINEKRKSAAYARDAKSAKSVRINDETDGDDQAKESTSVG